MPNNQCGCGMVFPSHLASCPKCGTTPQQSSQLSAAELANAQQMDLERERMQMEMQMRQQQLDMERQRFELEKRQMELGIQQAENQNRMETQSHEAQRKIEHQQREEEAKQARVALAIRKAVRQRNSQGIATLSKYFNAGFDVESYLTDEEKRIAESTFNTINYMREKYRYK